MTVRVTQGLVGRDRYVVRWLKGHAYVYMRQYEGAAGHAAPRLRDVYLGRIPDRMALRGSIEELSALAFRLRARMVGRLLREGWRQMRRARRRASRREARNRHTTTRGTR